MELLPPFLIGVAFFTAVFLMTLLIEITDIIVRYQVEITTVFQILIYRMPYFLQFVIPMSVMISVLLTFLRMSGDMEIVALKAGGISLYRLILPVFLFSALGCLITVFMTMYGLPKGTLASKKLIYERAAKHLEHLELGLKPRQFIDDFENVVLYFNEIDAQTKVMRDIFLEDRRSDDLISTVVAPEGRLFVQADQLIIHLNLTNGSIHQVDMNEGTVNTSQFGTNEIRLEMKESLTPKSNASKSVEEMTLAELEHYVATDKSRGRKYQWARMEWHKRFALPVACFVLALVAAPLGIRARSTKRSYGLGLGMFFFIIYYILLSFGWALGKIGLYPPVIGMWLPNVVSAAIGTFLLNNAVNERNPVLPVFSGWKALTGVIEGYLKKNNKEQVQ